VFYVEINLNCKAVTLLMTMICRPNDQLMLTFNCSKHLCNLSQISKLDS